MNISKLEVWILLVRFAGDREPFLAAFQAHFELEPKGGMLPDAHRAQPSAD